MRTFLLSLIVFCLGMFAGLGSLSATDPIPTPKGNPHPCVCGCDFSGKCACPSCNVGCGFAIPTPKPSAKSESSLFGRIVYAEGAFFMYSGSQKYILQFTSHPEVKADLVQNENLIKAFSAWVVGKVEANYVDVTSYSLTYKPAIAKSRFAPHVTEHADGSISWSCDGYRYSYDAATIARCGDAAIAQVVANGWAQNSTPVCANGSCATGASAGTGTFRSRSRLFAPQAFSSGGCANGQCGR